MKLVISARFLFFIPVLLHATAANFQDYLDQHALLGGSGPEIESGDFGTIIDETFSKRVEKLLKEHKAHGVSLTIVSRGRRDGGGIFEKIESGSWGNATEDGDPVTNQVQSNSMSW